MRLALTAGGTAGHVLPALSVLDAVLASYPNTIAAFFGPDDRGESAQVSSRGVPHHRVPSAAMRGRGPGAMLRNGWRVARGVLAGWRALRRFRPDVVLSTGGYGSFPCAVAARLLRTPLVVFLPDVSPGWAVKAESRLATKLATTTTAAVRHLPAAKTSVTGYPVRREFFTIDRRDARMRLELSPDIPLVLIAGASQGARAINQACFASLPRLLPVAVVVHITGEADAETAQRVRDALPERLRDRYSTSPFRLDLPAVMIGADLAVARAGASVLGELPAAGLPSLLVPGTFAGGHQRGNARFLAEAGAAEALEERDLGELADRVLALLAAPDRLAAMRRAAGSLARPQAAQEIASLIAEAAAS